MYQSVTAALEAYYLRRIFDEPIAATEEDTQKTLIQMCKNYNIYDCIYKPSLGVTNKWKDGIWKKTSKWFTHDFKGFAKYEELAKTNKVVVEMEYDLNMGINKDDMEEFLEVVPEELTNEESLEVEQEHKAERKVREKETAGELEEPPKIHSEVFSRNF